MSSHLNRRISIAAILTASILICCSCKKIPDPSAVISFEINGNSVTFTVDATHAESFNWDFGDGSQESTEKNPVHIFDGFGKDYNVTLTVKGPGGTKVVTAIISIPPLTKMEMLTGGATDTDGKAWKLDYNADVYIALPDAVLTVNQTFAKGVFNEWGFATAYLDKYIFYYNGSFSIEPSGQNIIGSRMYCYANNIPNITPSQAALSKGLTLITSYQAPTGMSYVFNESKDLQLLVCTDGENLRNVTFMHATTLSFSKDAFIGIKDGINECVLLELSEKRMQAAVFISTIPYFLPFAGKTTTAFILTFEPAE
jgi:hypothetical protein